MIPTPDVSIELQREIAGKRANGQRISEEN